MAKLLEVLTNASVRRFIVTLVTFATVALNKKFALGLDPNDLFDVVLVGLGYVGQSAGREALVAHADAKSELAAAIAKNGPQTPFPNPATAVVPPAP